MTSIDPPTSVAAMLKARSTASPDTGSLSLPEAGRRRMLVLCPYPQDVAAGQRLKYEQYFDDWRAAGWDIDVSSFMTPALWDKAYKRGHYGVKLAGLATGYARRLADLFRVARYDLVYVFMWVTPLGTSLFERLVRRLAAALVYDIEDNILTGSGPGQGGHPNPLLRFLKGSGKAPFLIRTANHVITSSPFLNDTCLTMNERHACTYISSSVDTDRFQPATPYDDSRPVTIGWTGTFSSREFLDLLRPVFQELARRVDFRLKVIGNFDYALPGVDLEVVQWTREHEVRDLQDFDIGVYPLPLSNWVDGKSGLKAIQYMAFALPIVASDVGTTPLLIRNEENGLLVRTEADWLDALERLVRNPALRRQLGTKARQDAVEKYSVRAIAQDYRRVLAESLEK